MFTIDVVRLIERLTAVEQESNELRGMIKNVREEMLQQVEEAKQITFDQIPKLSPEGNLVIETYDGEGNTVYGYVVAEIKSDEKPAA